MSPGSSVLETGCGAGRFLRVMAESNPGLYCGIDAAFSPLRMAEAGERTTSVAAMKADAMHLRTTHLTYASPLT